MHPRLSKLRYRAWHRGFREADLILGPFADRWVGELSAVELDQFEALLEEPDQDLYAWIIGQTEAPARLADSVLARIQAFRYEANAGRTADGA